MKQDINNEWIQGLKNKMGSWINLSNGSWINLSNNRLKDGWMDTVMGG